MLSLLPVVLPPSPTYHLVWADEFTQPGRPDPANWTYETGFVRNAELQWYQPDNARVENGALILEGRRERVANPRFDAASSNWTQQRLFAHYTSAAVETKGLHSWTYGRFDVRARVDARAGLWPAIWTLGTTQPWPKCGEVDLLEFYRDSLHANTAWADGTWNAKVVPIGEFTKKDKDWASKWHLWRMDWDKDRIRIYLDGRLMNETDLSKTVNKDGFNPFRQPHFLILNLAIGSIGGDPDKTDFPAKFEVDYVRVFQR